MKDQLQELLAYMRLLRREGIEQDNRILRRLAQPKKVEDFVGFFAEYGSGKERVDTIVISDLHLGSKHSLATALRRALARFSFNRLVLNGDIFDHLNFELRAGTRAGAERLAPHHYELLQEIQTIAQTHEVVWIEGNHDDGLAGLLGSISNAQVHREYVWEYRGKRYLALHGDQFDYFYRDHPVMYAVGTRIYTFIQRLGPSTMGLCKFLKRKTKLYTNAMTSSVEGALAHGKARRADVVLCGHTHFADQATGGDVEYYNSGGWTDGPCHLIAVGEAGVRIHAFDRQGQHLGALSPLAV